jgi:membrane fusion protein, copper/silver efflux system
MGCCGDSKFNKYMWIVLGVVILAIVIFSLTSCGKREPQEGHATKTSMDNQILYYTCGMHPSVRVAPEQYKSGTTTCPICNMNLTPVYKEKGKDEAVKEEKKILFYRNPMNPSITSEVPAKDEMGMDYIPVYEDVNEKTEYYGCGMEGEEHVFVTQQIKGITKCPVCGMPLKKLTKEEADTLKGVVSRVKIKGEQARLAGVKTDLVKKMHLYKEIRTVGTVAYDPELAIAQEEFISSLKASEKIDAGNIPEIKERAANLVESSKRKLKLLGLSSEQIDELARTKEIQTSLVLPEETMWVYGDVYEYELSWIKTGSKVKVTTSSLPGETFYGVISSVNPVLSPKTRSVRFRAEIENPELKLKPQMYVDLVTQSMYMGPDGEHMVLAVPKSAILNTGTRKIIWIDKQDGEYEGRLVEIGPEATATVDGREGKFYPVLKGVSEGELVVTEANFLIDSQSQISGVASSAYGGALESEEKKAPPIHQH